MQRLDDKTNNTLPAQPQDDGPNEVREATEHLFNEIYDAAIAFDNDKLNKIRDTYLLIEDHACFSVVLDSETPLTRLIKNGKYKAAAFLYNRHQTEMMKMEFALTVAGNKPLQKKFITLQEAHPKKALVKRYRPITTQQMVHCIEILKPTLDFLGTLTNNPSDTSTKIDVLDALEKRVLLDPRFMEACASIFSGNMQAITQLFEGKTWLLTSRHSEAFRGTIAYLVGKYYPFTVIPEIWPGDNITQQWFLKGFFVGGHTNQSKQLLNKKNLPNKLVLTSTEAMQQDRSNMLFMIYHPSILQSLLACIDRDDLRKMMADFLNTFQDEFNREHHEKINEILKKASILNRYMRTFNISYHQAQTLMQLRQSNKLQESMLLYKKHILNHPNVAFNILPIIKSTLLTDEQTKDLFEKIFFVTYQKELVNTLERYLSNAYQLNHHHINRAKSFKSACEKTHSTGEIKKLIEHQLGLFQHTAEGDENSQTKYEQPFGKKGKDEFIETLELYQNKIN